MIKNFDFSPLDKLTEQTKPSWGKMTPQHMVEHLTMVVQSSNGKIILNDCMNLPERFPVLKRFLSSTKALPKNFVNTVVGEGLKPLIHQNLELAKEDLLIEVENFELFFMKNPEGTPMNATFGPLNYDEWVLFHKKHFEHHFTQFGLIDEKL